MLRVAELDVGYEHARDMMTTFVSMYQSGATAREVVLEMAAHIYTALEELPSGDCITPELATAFELTLDQITDAYVSRKTVLQNISNEKMFYVISKCTNVDDFTLHELNQI